MRKVREPRHLLFQSQKTAKRLHSGKGLRGEVGWIIIPVTSSRKLRSGIVKGNSSRVYHEKDQKGRRSGEINPTLQEGSKTPTRPAPREGGGDSARKGHQQPQKDQREEEGNNIVRYRTHATNSRRKKRDYRVVDPPRGLSKEAVLGVGGVESR